MHRHLQDTNVIVGDHGLTGVNDFEQARVAEPLYDFVKVGDSVLPHHHDLAAAFLDAYGVDLQRSDIADRFAAVSILEYLSAIVYFDRRGQDELARVQVGQLDEVVETTLERHAA